MKNPALALIMFLGFVASTRAGFTEGGFASQSADQPLTISASFIDRQVAPDEPIEFLMNRPPNKAEGSLAVTVGRADLTALFTLAKSSLRYDPKMLPLPPGESEVTVFLVSPKNEWKELARFTLRVGRKDPPATENNTQAKPQSLPADPGANPPDQAARGAEEQGGRGAGEQRTTDGSVLAAGQRTTDDDSRPQKRAARFDKLDFIPAITVSIKSQPAQSTFPEANRPERPTFTDLNLQASFRSEMARGLFASETQFDFVGSSFQQEAIRFGQLGEDAPQIDLSSYLMQFQIGKAKYLLGHTSYGTNRQLISDFSSRGMTFALPLTSRLDFSAAAMNGTSIVGFENFFGLARRRHQLISSALGFEFLPKRPGGLRLETSVMDGWLQPISSFNQGDVNDAERSRGIGFRLIATDAAGRFRLDAGMARSQFVNPSDPFLDQGQNVVGVAALWRNARYADASYDLLKDFSVTKEKKANLTFSFRHERVDPLYRSLGASTQADKIQNEFSLNGSIGEISAQYAHLRLNDNLADIPSILKSNTRSHTLSAGTPLASLIGDPAKPSPLLPRVSYNFNRTLQFGVAIPAGGGFELDPAAVPDQVSTNQGLTADWQFQKVQFGYRLNHSFQNNRQAASDLADLTNLVNGFTVGISVASALDLSFDLNAESAFDKQSRVTDRTLRLAPGFNWRMNQKSVLASNVSFTVAGDAADIRNNRNISVDIQYSLQFGVERDRFRKVGGQFFIRYANQYARSRDRAFGLSDLTKNQTLNLGLSFTFF